MKISQLEETEIEHVNQSKVPIHNIGEERSVGFFNYEIGIRGKENVESASRKMILNKSNDLIDKKTNFAFRKFRTEAIKIKELKLQDKGFTEKDIINSQIKN